MKKIFYILLLAFVVIQFFQIDKTNPPVDETKDFLKINNTPEEAIATQIKASCYDCHSNESKYPWYSNIQPIAWFLKHHIDEGREELNFSEFGTYTAKRQAHKLDECAELIEKDEMPLSSYTIIHKDAVLDANQKELLLNYFKELHSKTKE